MGKRRFLYCFRSTIAKFYRMFQECWQGKWLWSPGTHSFAELSPEKNKKKSRCSRRSSRPWEANDAGLIQKSRSGAGSPWVVLPCRQHREPHSQGDFSWAQMSFPLWSTTSEGEQLAYFMESVKSNNHTKLIYAFIRLQDKHLVQIHLFT